MKIQAVKNKIHSLRSYAELNGVSRTYVADWVKLADEKGKCINKKTNESFLYVETNYMKLIIID